MINYQNINDEIIFEQIIKAQNNKTLTTLTQSLTISYKDNINFPHDLSFYGVPSSIEIKNDADSLYDLDLFLNQIKNQDVHVEKCFVKGDIFYVLYPNLTSNEICMLIPYCQCYFCTMSFWNPLKYFSGTNRFGYCLKPTGYAIGATYETILKTFQYINSCVSHDQFFNDNNIQQIEIQPHLYPHFITQLRKYQSEKYAILV